MNCPLVNITCAISLTWTIASATSKTIAADFLLTETDSTITVSLRTKTVVVYNKRSPPVPADIDPIYRRSGFLHPVASPRGQVVTATFPFDHPHQHGIFSAWVKTTYGNRPIDFWNLAGHTGRVLHERVVSTFQGDQSAGFEVDLLHHIETDPAINVLRERWRITVFDVSSDYHCFELETEQRALTDTPLKISKYHYGGIALRGPTRWLTEPDASREPSAFLNSLGSNRIDGNHQHAQWVVMTGTINRQDVSIAVLCHADNFRAPQAARLHPTKPYFCFAPCVDDEFTIDRDHPYRARYRYLVTDAAPDAVWLDMQWEAWCGL